MIEPINKILSDTVCVKLEVLSGNISAKDLDKYKQELEDYEYEFNLAESRGMTCVYPKPKEPNLSIEYTIQWFNFMNKEIDSWSENYDEERDCTIIVLNYFDEEGLKQINIKSSVKDWMNLLESLGAHHIG